jgi:hypothetical protein
MVFYKPVIEFLLLLRKITSHVCAKPHSVVNAHMLCNLPNDEKVHTTEVAIAYIVFVASLLATVA